MPRPSTLPTATRSGPRELAPEVIDGLKADLTERGLPAQIYKFVADGDTFVFRPLYRPDWNQIQAFVQDSQGNVRQDDLDRRICEKALLWPEETLHPAVWETQKAGYQGSLAKMVLARSGFFDPEIDQSSYLRVEPLVTVPRGEKPAPEVVETLKAKYNWSLKLVQIDSEYYVVRPLSRGEWKLITSGDDPDVDLAAAERATVWSREYPSKPSFDGKVAGTCRSLSEVIMMLSGFVSQPTVEEL